MIKCVLYSFILLFNSRSIGRIIQQLTQETIHPVVKTRSTELHFWRHFWQPTNRHKKTTNKCPALIL